MFCVASKGSTNFRGTQLLEKAPTSDFSSLRAFLAILVYDSVLIDSRKSESTVHYLGAFNKKKKL